MEAVERKRMVIEIYWGVEINETETKESQCGGKQRKNKR